MDIIKVCISCRAKHIITVEGDDYMRWRAGVHAQDAFPYLSADDREMLISSICPECFEEMFRHEEEPHIVGYGPAWPLTHGVNCYFCGKEFDEREGQPADAYNNDDGGDICPECLAARQPADKN